MQSSVLNDDEGDESKQVIEDLLSSQRHKVAIQVDNPANQSPTSSSK